MLHKPVSVERASCSHAAEHEFSSSVAVPTMTTQVAALRFQRADPPCTESEPCEAYSPNPMMKQPFSEQLPLSR